MNAATMLQVLLQVYCSMHLLYFIALETTSAIKENIYFIAALGSCAIKWNKFCSTHLFNFIAHKTTSAIKYKNTTKHLFYCSIYFILLHIKPPLNA